jgi:putative hydrolase of the HAD superfamily
MPVRAVLLDAFGTIIHPEPGWEGLRRECLTIVHGTWTGRAVPLDRFLAAYEEARAAQHAHVREGFREFDFPARFSDAILRCGAPRDEGVAWGRFAHERYHRFQQGLIHAYDQPGPTLASLREAGHRLALVSNYNHGGVVRDALQRLGLLHHFDAVIVSGEVGYLKPSPKIFHAALDALGAKPNEAVFVGNDLENDITAPKRLGLRTVWTPYPRTSPAPSHPDADAVVERLADLPKVLESFS